jgi:lysozyme
VIHEQALELIKEFEGCYLNAYRCPAGVFTIGYGSTTLGKRKVQEGDILWDEAEAHRILVNQLEQDYIPFLEIIPGWERMNPNQQSALISFAWNLGAHFYNSYGFETITKHLQDRKWERVPDALLLYVKANGKTLPGLVRRRQAEADLWITPVGEGCLGLDEYMAS